MQLSSQSNESIQTVDLQALSKIHSDQEPVFSLYLDLRPDKQNAKDLLLRFENLLRQTEQQKKLDQDPSAYKQRWAGEAEKVRGWLKTVQPGQAQGLVIFTSQAASLWKSFLLPVPVSDRLIAADRAYVRPLEILLGETQCTLLVLIDEGTARLIKVTLGTAEEIASIQAMPVTGDAFGSGFQPVARMIAERAEAAWQELPCAFLAIGGPDEPLRNLRAALSETLSEQLLGTVRLSSRTGVEEILAQVQEIEAEQERRLEAQRVELLIASARDGSGETAVLGQEQTLLAVRAKKARLLVAEEDFHQAGGRCPNCGYLGEWEQGTCPFCEMALRPEPDIIEAALKRVLDEGGEVDVLRSPETRHALEPYGRIGALLHDAEPKPTEKNPSNHATLASGGKSHPDAQHDEAVDESFPASDPPGW